MWAQLYNGYRSFYELPADHAAVATTWEWMLGRQHGLRGIVAVNSSAKIVALANLRLFARPSTGQIGLYLDDLFTSSESRGSGAAGAPLQPAAVVAAEECATVIRWITAKEHSTARRVYDALASATDWVTYDMKPSDT